MTDASLQQLSFHELKAALAHCSDLSAYRHRLRRECQRRIERCNQLLNCAGLTIIGYLALVLLLSH